MRRPIVVKLGSSLIAGPRGTVRRSILRARAREVGELVAAGQPVCIVTSGAIALGLRRLGLDQRPRSVPKLQAASALGQGQLQAAWDRELARAGAPAGQILLSAGEIADRAGYLNLHNALLALLNVGAVPVINENDAVATDEITFGDNDALAAQVAVLAHARLLILLTEVDGVYTRAPGTPGAELIRDAAAVRDAVLGDAGSVGRGGMRSKVLAAEMAASAGIPTVIAGGTGAEVLGPILAGEPRGTRFTALERTQSAYKLWLRFGKTVSGRLHLDWGAHRAVVEQGASLLAVGITHAEGDFQAGDGIRLIAPDGQEIGKGIASAAATEITSRSHGTEAIHRDHLVLY